ncbi:MAG: HIT family protein [Candidatus Falkowbacteria bacterium]
MSCIFCRIISGEVESSKVYEDDQILAFLDLHPVRAGQLLVIPKEHIDHFSDIPDELAAKIFLKSHQISKVIKEKLKPERMGLVVHGYGVPHAHMVIVPQHHEDDITTGKMAKIENGKIIFTADNLPASSREELNKIAEIIKNESLD